MKKDVIVIGGGIIGVASAYYLALQGRSVMLIEKDKVCAGASHGNAGLIANGFAIPLAAPGAAIQGIKMMLDSSGPFYIKPRLNLELLRWLWKFHNACNEKQMQRSIRILLALGQGSFELFDELLATEKIKFDYERKGRLILFSSEKSFASGMADVKLLAEFGVEASLLDAEGVRQFEPNVMPTVKHGIFCSSYGHVSPDLFTHKMARLAAVQGVEIKTATAVNGFEKSAQKITTVVTAEDSYSADQIVLAGGAWSPEIVGSLKLRLPIQPAKGYSLTYKCPPNSPQLPLSLSERKVAVTPMGEKLRFTSTFELVGFDPSVNQRRLEMIRSSAQEYLSGMDELEDETVWSGYRPATPDDLPIIGRSEKYENLVLATGHGTLGMTHSLITGKLVAQIMANEQPSIDLKALSPERFYN
ncbi:MAG: FAD-dependent oxidoreductase [SAR324 cluster bacterium]|nr:FAD-dependent oxidoreductase [SAR324 cluster bacterium]